MEGRSLRSAEIAAAAPGPGPAAPDNWRNLQKQPLPAARHFSYSLEQGTTQRWFGNLAGRGDLGLTFCAKLGFQFLLLLRKGCEQCGTRSSLLHIVVFQIQSFTVCSVSQSGHTLFSTVVALKQRRQQH